MKIISPGIKEGLLYQRTTVWVPSRTLFMRKEAYRLLKDIENCSIDEWIESFDWSWVTNPEQKASSIQSKINWRENMHEELESYRCHYSWIVAYKDPEETENLGESVDKAAAVFAKDAVIRTLEEPRFDQEGSNRLREYPVPEGVMYYFRTEIRKMRQELIEEID